MDWTVVQNSLPMFEKGFWLTLRLSFFGIIGAGVLGLICSFIQYFKVPVLRKLVSAYVELSRNTPLLIQLGLAE
ncbi:ABC transporter permease subunit [Heyndrickxia coagulans]|uniref:Polar amino acid transport system permease protein n=1 Tax=Heyndrickxia coagulans DSM 1 = ATCC 7050 TaxID=1121088 RepID=A0A8B4BYR2_HEYCO|nr:ABC transporter permease subunit [Heyndrickxia coagulans]AJH78941.1 amino ABC transporter, permease, 3-TM region, His/Glu/Gln/Arg/opine family domain protein [Heyndrickxia coagulans DSM 1 = ATCC 7050]MED4495602.1 ABC transporter permease subunit [Heyndrickxia coagulans]MED4536325.1 ABC transporter permease subunit [Heyndrickxia coagulans]UYM80892.1 ABC transporter permease subunit [Heyndrickxia coagulans]SHG02316.1 polar amino acid transport system permease protein [Heyndrickxia coagulans D